MDMRYADLVGYLIDTMTPGPGSLFLSGRKLIVARQFGRDRRGSDSHGSHLSSRPRPVGHSTLGREAAAIQACSSSQPSNNREAYPVIGWGNRAVSTCPVGRCFKMWLWGGRSPRWRRQEAA